MKIEICDKHMYLLFKDRIHAALESAIKRSNGDHTLEEILACLGQEYTLWAAHQSGVCIGAAVTEICDETLIIPYAGILTQVLHTFERCMARFAGYASLLGCKRIQVCSSRKGYHRLVEPLGFKMTSKVYTCALSDFTTGYRY